MSEPKFKYRDKVRVTEEQFWEGVCGQEGTVIDVQVTKKIDGTNHYLYEVWLPGITDKFGFYFVEYELELV